VPQNFDVLDTFCGRKYGRLDVNENPGVINHTWSAMKQCLHLQSVAEISHHSVLSGDRI